MGFRKPTVISAPHPETRAVPYMQNNINLHMQEQRRNWNLIN